MKKLLQPKALFLTKLLLVAVMTTACVEKNIAPTAQAIEVHDTPSPNLPRSVQTTSPIVNSGEQHQLLTVQGPLIHVQERSNGFLFPQYKDKIILLQIFGKECPYCFEEIPLIQRMQRRYANKLNIIALQAQDKMTQATAQGLIQKFHMNYPIIDKEEAINLLHFIKTTYNWTGVLPYTLLIKNGVTEYSFAGKINPQELEESVRSLL